MNYYELEPEKNRFCTILADITHRCNMHCANCYIPNRSIPDMDKLRLFDLLRRLPFRSEVRLIGAEPTMRQDLPEIIAEVKKTGHRPVLVTNGLKLASLPYARSLREAGLLFAGISLNGGGSDKIYKKTDGGAFARLKVKALENMGRLGFVIGANIIIVRGLNEDAPLWVYRKLKSLRARRALIRVKNIGSIGRSMADEVDNYSFRELVGLMAERFGLDENWILSQRGVSGHTEKNIVLFPLGAGAPRGGPARIYMKITNWFCRKSGLPDPDSARRGRITRDFKIAPCFEHIKRNEFGY